MRLGVHLQQCMRYMEFPLRAAPLGLLLAALWGAVSLANPHGDVTWRIVVLALAVFWPALTWVLLWTECRSWALRSRDLKQYQGLLIERIRIEWEAATVGEKVAGLCLPEARACHLPAEELYQAIDALSRVDRRHAIYEQLADLYCRTRCNVSKKKRALDQRYAELLTDPPTDAFAYGRPPAPLQAIFYLQLKYQSPKWTLQLDQHHLARVLLDRQPAADGRPLHTPGCYLDETLPRTHQEWEMLLSPAFKKSFRVLSQSSQQVILRAMLGVAGKTLERPCRLVGSAKFSHREAGDYRVLYLPAPTCRKILFIDIVSRRTVAIPHTLVQDDQPFERRPTPTRESAIREWGGRARREHHVCLVLRSRTMGTNKRTPDESIGRPEEWREDRYEIPGKPVDQSVNNPAQREGEPLDTFGTQTPPHAEPASDTKNRRDPRDRPVTLEDYEVLKPLPAGRAKPGTGARNEKPRGR
jgi:hypothetical protein